MTIDPVIANLVKEVALLSAWKQGMENAFISQVNSQLELLYQERQARIERQQQRTQEKVERERSDLEQQLEKVRADLSAMTTKLTTAERSLNETRSDMVIANLKKPEK